MYLNKSMIYIIGIKVLPFPVEHVSSCRVNVLEFLFKIRSQMDRAVEVLPNQGVMLNILNKVVLCYLSGGKVFDSIN